MTTISNTGDVYNNYLRIEDKSKPDIRNLISKILKNAADTSEALTESHKYLNSPEYQNMKPTLRLNDRLKNWYRDFETENLNHRRNTARLMDSLKGMIGGLPQSQNLFNDIGNINRKCLNDENFQLGFKPGMGDTRKIKDAIKILETTPSPSMGNRRGSLSRLSTTPVRRGSLSRHDSRSRVIRNPSLKRLHNPSTPSISTQGNTINHTPSAPKYYRIDENGNRIQIDGPVTPGKFTTPLGRKPSLSPIRPSVGAERIPLAPIQNQAVISPMGRTASVQHLNPGLIHPAPGMLHPSRSTTQGLLQPTPMMGAPIVQPLPVVTAPIPVPEKKIYFTDPRTGGKMVRVLTPRGTNVLRVEPADMITMHPGVLGRSPSGVIIGKTPATNPQLDPHTKRMIDDAKGDFSNPVIEDFEVSDYPCKIECNHNGSILYYGGDTLGEINRRNKWLENSGIKSELQLSTLKSLPNGDIICNDLSNWDLVLLDRNFNELKRVAGNGVGVPRYYRFMKTRVSEDDRHIIWIRGPSEISLVDTRDFSARHIHNFWNFRGENSKGTVVAIDPTASKVVGIGFIENPGGYQTMHVYDGTDGVTAFEASDVIPEVKAWLCLESSVDGDAIFVGGAEHRNFETGSAYLAALSFDENAELINFSKFDNGFNCFNSLRRHPDGNILFAGCRGHLAVLLWVNHEFHLITQLPNIVNNPISDICFNNNVVYTVADHNIGRAYYFDNNLIKGRDPDYKSKLKPVSVGGNYKRPRMAERYLNREKVPPKYQNLFRDYRIKQIAIPGAELQRIQVSEDQRYIYTGKNDLKVLELRGERYTLLNVGDHINRFIDIKLLKNDELLVFEEETSDLVKYDRNLKEIQRLRGKKKINISKFILLNQKGGAEIVTSLYSGDYLTYIWMPGDNSIGLVNPDTMVHDIIANFFGPVTEEVIPFTVVASHKEKKVLGLYIVSRTEEMNFVFLRSGNGLIRKSQLEVLGEEGAILCLETSIDENILFAGGGTQLQLNQGIAKIFALTFDEDIEYITDLILPSSKMNTMGVSDIKRMRDRDVLFVGTKRNLFVVEWSGSHFYILNHIEDIHSWLLNNIDSIGVTCFTVSKEDDHINKITFTR